MKILNIIQCTNLGGMEQASLRLMKGLQGRGHLCHVISLNRLGGLAPLLTAAGIGAEDANYRGIAGWCSFFPLRRLIGQTSADVVLMTGHNVMAMIALASCNIPGRKVLAMHHHHEGVKSKLSWKVVYGIAANIFDFITFPSDFVREEAEAIAPWIRNRSVTVRNPLPNVAQTIFEQKSEARRRLGIPVNARVVGNAGWLIPRKRFDVFLSVARRLADRDPSFFFAIAGDGPLRQGLEHRAQKEGLTGCIRWLGWIEDLTTFYQSLDVFLFNSDFDAFPTSPLEAMSHGVPVVASAIKSGLKEVITQEREGWVFAQHDVDALVAAVHTACERRDEVGAAGRARVQSDSNADVIVNKMIDLLGT